MQRIPRRDILSAFDFIAYDVHRMDEACEYLSHIHPSISREDIFAEVMNVLATFCRVDKTPIRKTHARHAYYDLPTFELSPRDYEQTPSSVSSASPSPWNRFSDTPFRNDETEAIIRNSLAPRRLSFSNCPPKKKRNMPKRNPLLGYRMDGSSRNRRTPALIPLGLLMSDSSDSD